MLGYWNRALPRLVPQSVLAAPWAVSSTLVPYNITGFSVGIGPAALPGETPRLQALGHCHLVPSCVGTMRFGGYESAINWHALQSPACSMRFERLAASPSLLCTTLPSIVHTTRKTGP